MGRVLNDILCWTQGFWQGCGVGGFLIAGFTHLGGACRQGCGLLDGSVCIERGGLKGPKMAHIRGSGFLVGMVSLHRADFWMMRCGAYRQGHGLLNGRDCMVEMLGFSLHWVIPFIKSFPSLGHSLHWVIPFTWAFPSLGHPLHWVIPFTWAFPLLGHPLHWVFLFIRCFPSFPFPGSFPSLDVFLHWVIPLTGSFPSLSLSFHWVFPFTGSLHQWVFLDLGHCLHYVILLSLVWVVSCTGSLLGGLFAKLATWSRLGEAVGKHVAVAAVQR